MGALSEPQTYREEVHLWGRWEGAFTADRPRTDAIPAVQSVTLEVAFAAPSGARRLTTGFWDGDETWRVRFCPDEIGTWQYATRCSDSADLGLHGQSGSFACTPYSGTNPLFQHGQIRVSATGRHLEHADGTPFFFLADTCWNGPHLAEPDEWQQYLADRTSKHFSAVLFTAPHFRALPSNADGRLAFAGREQIEIDPRFFQRLDRAVDAMNDNGLLAVPLLLHAGKDTDLNTGHFLPKEQAIVLARYLVARYDAHHVLWDFVAEAEFHGAGARYWKEVGRAVFGTGHRHPVTLHPYGMDWALDDFADESWMDVVGYQSAHGDNEAYLRWIPEGPPSRSWRLKPPRPFINLEPPYEGHRAHHSGQPFDAATVRRHSYWSLLVSPVAGVAYGAHGVWGWDDGSGAPFAHEDTGWAPRWQDALNFPGSTSMRCVAELMASIPWWTLAPAPELLASQLGVDDPRLTVVAARGDGGRLGVVYVPRGSRATLDREAAAALLGAAWFNPASGARRPVTELIGVDAQTFVPPEGQDAVLLFEALPAVAS